MPANKGLVVLVGVLGVAIIAALGVLAFGLVQQAKDPDFKFFKDSTGSTAPATGETLSKFGNISIRIPADATVRGYRIDGERLIIQLDSGPAGAPQTQLLFLDAANGTELGRIRLVPEK